MPNSPYNTVWWKKARIRLLKKESLCRECLRDGKLSKATTVDHIKPWKKRSEFYCEDSNLQGLCHSCHNRKSNAEKYESAWHKRKETEIRKKTAIQYF